MLSSYEKLKVLLSLRWTAPLDLWSLKTFDKNNFAYLRQNIWLGFRWLPRLRPPYCTHGFLILHSVRSLTHSWCTKDDFWLPSAPWTTLWHLRPVKTSLNQSRREKDRVPYPCTSHLGLKLVSSGAFNGPDFYTSLLSTLLQLAARSSWFQSLASRKSISLHLHFGDQLPK